MKFVKHASLTAVRVVSSVLPVMKTGLRGHTDRVRLQIYGGSIMIDPYE